MPPAQSCRPDAATARTLLSELAAQVSSVLGRRVTAWEIDHAIWTSARSVRTELHTDQDEPHSEDRSRTIGHGRQSQPVVAPSPPAS
ncbi:hypothetical protein [Rhodococcus chondri]|uniref:Uncharacterized protein n=1 Tax=Rhodococcus chondri TaxID=3065941 RepID=A0ABU7JYK0_9NOCA|nr:hypothetical protein [Rhodococcus sp. CC-R104]MEE2034619.1 hypothetical protein [Rhodococcus sp. CC-R104]